MGKTFRRILPLTILCSVRKNLTHILAAPLLRAENHLVPGCITLFVSVSPPPPPALATHLFPDGFMNTRDSDTYSSGNDQCTESSFSEIPGHLKAHCSLCPDQRHRFRTQQSRALLTLTCSSEA